MPRRIRIADERFWPQSGLVEQLSALGLAPGDAVMVHASLRRVGPMPGGVDTLIAALRERIGADGTLLAYTSWEEVFEDALDADGRLPEALKPHIPPFDAAASRASRDHGVLAEAIRTTPGARRSGNPGASVAALGARAAWFTADHPLDYGYGADSPFARLVAAGGKVLMAGAPLDTMSLLHHAEHLAQIPNKRIRRAEVPIAGPNGVVWHPITEFDTVDPVVDGLADDYFGTIVRDFLATGAGRTGRIGSARAVLVPAAAMAAFAVTWLETRVPGA